ncbi:hypothetical protein [uncultured Adlercreutzia sp.]|uniref:hypothetical protein n=1 Tax=uncultured Adlercreutzia sp. TaxID=875803 RepID=UPI0025E8B48A|nr:hypothetical protein [uncultured Adlercreutzia sp.]
MTSRKGAAKARRREEFLAGLGEAEDVFAREERRREKDAEAREAVRRKRGCESKQRYASRYEAEVTIAECRVHGAPPLHAYRCPYCNGWHLTSKPERE